MTRKARIAHLAGPNATIQNTPPLVTSNKARVKHQLPPLTNPDGSPARFDVLRAQRLAAPVTIYVEQFSAHPLEADAAELYGPPDGYIDSAGQVHREQQSADDKPVYEVELRPEDGLYPLPYMALQADGAAWEEECAFLNAPEPKARQGFFSDGSRSFEEIDRLQIGEHGTGNLISGKAEIDFYRILPPSGYTKGLSADRRTDTGSGDIPRKSDNTFGDQAAGMVPRTGGFLTRTIDPQALPTWLTEADIDFFAGEFGHSGFRGGLNWYRNIDRNWELLAPFAGAKVTVPALYMAGDRDVVVKFPRMDQLIANLKTFVPELTKTIMLPGCGHWTQQERADEVNAALIAFLHEVG